MNRARSSFVQIHDLQVPSEEGIVPQEFTELEIEHAVALLAATLAVGRDRALRSGEIVAAGPPRPHELEMVRLRAHAIDTLSVPDGRVLAVTRHAIANGYRGGPLTEQQLFQRLPPNAERRMTSLGAAISPDRPPAYSAGQSIPPPYSASQHLPAAPHSDPSGQNNQRPSSPPPSYSRSNSPSGQSRRR